MVRKEIKGAYTVDINVTCEDYQTLGQYLSSYYSNRFVDYGSTRMF